MFEQFNTRERRLANERALYRYRQALERGDIETITTILQEASQNAALEQLIYALHDLDQLVEPAPVSTHPMQQNEQPTFTHLPLPMVRSRVQRPMRKQGVHPRLQTFAAILMVLALIVGFVSLYSTSSLHPRMPIATQTVTTSQGIIILLFDNGDIQAVRPITGKRVWRYFTGLSIDTSVNYLSVQNHVVYAMITNHLYALDEETGHLLWQKAFVVSPTIASDMNIDAGIVYISIRSNSQSSLYALAAEDGHSLWDTANNASINDLFLAANDGVVYLLIQNTTSSQATIEARHGFDGSILWKQQAFGNTWFATVANQALYVAYDDNGSTPPSGQHLLALNVNNGDLIWYQDVSLYNTLTDLAYGQNTLVIGSLPQLCAYNADNGDELWCHDPSNTPANTVEGLRDYLAGSDKFYTLLATPQESVIFQALDFRTGQLLWSKALAYNADKYPLLSLYLVQLRQNTLLVSIGSSLLAGLDADDGRVLWQINEYESPAVVQIVASAS